MGIQGFTHFFKKCIKEKKIEDYKNSQLVIDANYQLYRYGIAIRQNGTDLCNLDGRPINHIHAIISYTNFLLRSGIKPIYIFDGKSPDLKKSTINDRITCKKKAIDSLGNIIDKKSKEFIKNFSKSYTFSKKEIKDCVGLLDLLNIPYIQSIGEADIYCAALDMFNQNINGIITNDTDLLVFGAKKIMRKFSKKNVIEEINLDDIYDHMKFLANEIKINNNTYLISRVTHENFIDFSILLGTDYTPHIKGFNSSELYELFVLNDFNLEKTVNKLNEIINTSVKKNDYDVPANFLNMAKSAKDYYLQTKNILLNDLDKQHFYSKPNRDKLIIYLRDKLNMDKKIVANIMNLIDRSETDQIFQLFQRKRFNNYNLCKYTNLRYKYKYNYTNNLNNKHHNNYNNSVIAKI